jgi:uncharacterized damage-inducible protein DinB
MTPDPIKQPEPWLRGRVEGISEALTPVAHAFIAAREDVIAPLAGLGAAQLWAQPGGVASIGFHLMHLAGATDRLLTYARGAALSDQQKAALGAEKNPPEPRPTADELLKAWDAAVERALKQIGETTDAELGTPRFIGRAQLPSTVRGLLFHAAEHATRHAGQIITTAKVVRG